MNMPMHISKNEFIRAAATAYCLGKDWEIEDISDMQFIEAAEAAERIFKVFFKDCLELEVGKEEKDLEARKQEELDRIAAEIAEKRRVQV